MAVKVCHPGDTVFESPPRPRAVVLRSPPVIDAFCWTSWQHDSYLQSCAMRRLDISAGRKTMSTMLIWKEQAARSFEHQAQSYARQRGHEACSILNACAAIANA